MTRQLQLLEGGAPARPSRREPSIVEDVADGLLEAACEWARQDDEKEDVDSVRKQLVAVLDDELDWDGYSLARGLERRYGWASDTELVEILDDASCYRSKAHDDLLRGWIAKWDIRPAYAIGARVSFPHEGGKVVGEIISIDAGRATYTVFCESLGHVRRGSRPDGGTLGIIVDFEETEAAS